MMGTPVFFPRFLCIYCKTPSFSVAFISQVSLWQSGFPPASFACILLTGEAILLADQGITGNAVYSFVSKTIY